MESNFIGVKDLASQVRRKFLNLPPVRDENAELMGSIQKARRDWYMAENRFNEFTDPHLVDSAIYEMMAARSKYQYLVQCAKEKGLRL